MDILGILRDHLGLIERFYDAAASIFETTKHEIETHEEPFVPKHPPGDHDGPEYLDEWSEADACLRVLGQTALGLLQEAMHDYLREFIMREAEVMTDEALSKGLSVYQGSWFQKYSAFLLANTAFTWEESPTTKGQIEQINLTRNDFTHDATLGRIWPKQSEEHFKKFPVSTFVDDFELGALKDQDGSPTFPLLLTVTRENLFGSIESVRRLCTYVEAQRTKW